MRALPRAVAAGVVADAGAQGARDLGEGALVRQAGRRQVGEDLARGRGQGGCDGGEVLVGGADAGGRVARLDAAGYGGRGVVAGQGGRAEDAGGGDDGCGEAHVERVVSLEGFAGKIVRITTGRLGLLDLFER